MIVTPLDSAELDSKKQYEFYHKMVDFTIKELIVKIQRHALCTDLELRLFKQFSDLLSYSIEAMRIKYMYDEEANMKIDLTDSGFPNYLEFRYLYNDLALREEYINKLTSVEILQEEFLDTLLRKQKPINKERLFQAASIVYYTKVKQEHIFNRFVQGKILQLSEQKAANYMVSWSFYDVSYNRPFVCYMYFDYDGKDPNADKIELYSVLKQSADRKMNLDAMAYAIDRKLPNFYPKLIKRIDLGPFHNVFAKDENQLTHAILDGISKKEIPLESYAFSLKIDEIKSVEEFKEGTFFNKQIFQKWTDILHYKYLFAPHRIIQMFHNKTPNTITNLAKAPIEVSSL